jgi:hypothetical protein
MTMSLYYVKRSTVKPRFGECRGKQKEGKPDENHGAGMRLFVVHLSYLLCGESTVAVETARDPEGKQAVFIEARAFPDNAEPLNTPPAFTPRSSVGVLAVAPKAGCVTSHLPPAAGSCGPGCAGTPLAEEVGGAPQAT